MKKVLFILLGVLGLGLAAGWAWLSSRIDEESIRDYVTKAVSQSMGKELLIDGGLSVTKFPSPRVVMAGVGIRNTNQASTEYFLQASRVEIDLSFSSLLSGSPQISNITVVRPVLELESFKDGSNNWSQPQTSPAGSSPDLPLSSVNIQEGAVHYRNEYTRFYRNLDNINAILGWGVSGISLSGNFQYRDHPFALDGSIGGFGLSSATPVKIDIAQNNTHFLFEGEVSKPDGNLQMKGKASMNSEDIYGLLNGQADGAPAETPQALTIESGIVYNGDLLEAKSISISGTDIKGQGQLLARMGAIPQVSLALAFDSLKLKPFVPLFSLSELENVSASSSDPYAQALQAQEGKNKQTITRNLAMKFQLTAKKMNYETMNIENFGLQAQMEEGEVEVQQARGVLPGQSTFLVIGFLRDTFRGPTFEGSLESEGMQMAKVLTIFGVNEKDFPQQDFGRYRGKTRIVVTSKEMHLSDLDIQVEKMRAVGTLITTFGQLPTVQGVIQLVGLDLDHLVLPLLNPISAAVTGPDAVNEPSAAVKGYGWLQRFPAEVAINAAMGQYILYQKPRENIQFSLKMRPGKATLEDVKTVYNGSNIKGGVTLDITQQQPLISIDLTADTFDPTKFFEKDFSGFTNINEGVSREGRWSKKEFNLSSLEGWSGDFKFQFGQFVHEDYDLQNVVVQGKLEDRLLNINSIQGKLGGADVKGSLSLSGGKVPAIASVFSANNVSIEKLRPYLPLINSIKGFVTLSGEIKTSGVNMYSWIAGLQGVINFTGKEVQAEGFNLSAIIRSVAAVRSVSDILITVRNAYPSGVTRFDQVKGALNLESGTVRTPGILIVAEQTQGSIVGEVDLIKWVNKLFVKLNLTALDRAKPPVLKIIYSESLDNPKLDFDTSELEWYVDQKTRSRLLEQGAPEPP